MMTILKTAILCAAMLSPGIARAEICTFTSECFEGEACAETSFAMEITDGALVTDAETIPVTSGGSDTVNVFVGYTASAFHVLTRQVEGEARYSTHIFDGPLMVNYLGTCA
ncbi:MAG: hypothetical protein AAGA08_09020 [Pseudomonadota bacterium]